MSSLLICQYNLTFINNFWLVFGFSINSLEFLFICLYNKGKYNLLQKGDRMKDMTLGQKVKEARITKQMTQRELAGDFITRNMLSQIENDNATPSIKTIEYIASVLDKPISYFMNDDNSNQVSIIQELLVQYKAKKYYECMKLIETSLQDNLTDSVDDDLIKDIYVNCCLKAATLYKDSGHYKMAHETLNKVFKIKSEADIDTRLSLYKSYLLMSEIYGYLNNLEQCKFYFKKSIDLYDQLTLSHNMQKCHLSFLENEYEQVIENVDLLDVNQLTDSDKGRYYLLTALSYYKQDSFSLALPFYEKAIPYYKENDNTHILTLVYEHLSRCYYHIEDYKKAYQLLELVKNQPYKS